MRAGAGDGSVPALGGGAGVHARAEVPGPQRHQLLRPLRGPRRARRLSRNGEDEEEPAPNLAADAALLVLRSAAGGGAQPLPARPPLDHDLRGGGTGDGDGAPEPGDPTAGAGATLVRATVSSRGA